jgi:hypothetical protein
VRVEQSRQELDRLVGDVEAWVAERAHADRHKRHSSQLECLRLIIETALGAVRSSLDAVSTREPSGEVYEQCREVDRRALILRRLWQFFASRWDQRDDPKLGPVLAAADEVVWSCWAGPFRVLSRAPTPAPLPYIEPLFSPHAVPRLRPPQEIKVSDDLLGALLAKLPIPLIGIPPICVQRPWWLVMIAHETGHHIAYDLLDEPTTKRIRAVVTDAAQTHGEEADTAWAQWTHELFADAFAVACVGEAQLWAVEELELASDEQMAADAGRHPPALARRSLNRAVLAALTGERGKAREYTPPPGRLRRFLEETGPVAHALVEAPLDEPERRSLRVLCDWRDVHFASSGEVPDWTQELLSPRELAPSTHLAAARLAAASSVAAWRSVSSEPDAALRECRRESLRQRTINLISNCREAGTRRAGASLPDDVMSLAEELARTLIDTPLEA